MRRRRRVWLSVLVRGVLAVVLLGASIGIFLLLRSAREQPERHAGGELAPRVPVILAQPVKVRRQWEAFGTSRAVDTADVPARVASVVEEIPGDVEEGLAVEAGQLLVRLDDSDFAREAEIARKNIDRLGAEVEQARIEETSWRRRVELAEERVEIAEADYERVLQAFQEGGARQREVDESRQQLIAAIQDETAAQEALRKIAPRIASLEAQIEAERSRLELAELNIERSMVRSPIAGLLQAVDVEVGEHVNPGQRLARVVSLDRLEVPLQIAAGVRPFLELGEEVRIIGTGTDERVWESTIGRIAPESDPETRTLTIYAEVTQPAATEEGLNGALAPGQFVRALVLATNVQERWVVPRRSVDEGGILIVNDEHIRRRPIEIDYQVEMKLPRFGVKDALWVVLEEPLEPGLPVVINPTPALIEGMQVEPAPAAQPRDVEVRSGAAEEMANAEAGP